MSVDENKAIVLRYFEESHNKRNLAIIDELLEPEYGKRVKEWMTMELAAFPDGRYIIEDVVAERDKVLLRWTWSGTHRSPIWTPVGTIAATGQHVTSAGMLLYRVANGKLVEEWLGEDWLHFVRQLGVEVRLPGESAGVNNCEA